MKSYTTTQARQNFSELVNQVKYQKKIIAIGRNKSQNEVLLVPYPDIEATELPITNINAGSASFDFLDVEPSLYSLDDLKKRYV